MLRLLPRWCTLGAALACSAGHLRAELGHGLIEDSFDSLSGSWIDIAVQGSQLPAKSVADGWLTLTTSAGPSAAGVYHAQPVSGNFYAEVDFGADDAVGLALIRNHDGVPDLRNFTMLAVTNRAGIVHINQYDQQNGVADVGDPRGQVAASRYRAALDGTQFSLPFTSTNKKIRILHEALSNSFHFYYGTRLTKFGITSDDWMELAPQYSWLPPDEDYFVALLVRNEGTSGSKQARFNALKVWQTPTDDANDSTTGFKAVKRDFSWSGFNGTAAVVSFGEDFDYDRNIKFTIWETANNAPAWRITNQFLLNFEFFEAADLDFEGSMEAMNDRQRHGQSVTILEDNPVRKVIRWRGIPMNPDYRISAEGSGIQMPVYEETWTLYPDGTGTRRLIDMPKTDAPSRRRWGPEFIEPMAIGGSTVEAGDLLASPAITFSNLTGRESRFLPPNPEGIFDPGTWNWDELIFHVHFKDPVPDFFIAFSQSPAIADTWSGLKLQGQMSWHRTDFRFSHWPVGREPYGQNVSPTNSGRFTRSFATHANEVTHTSLASAGFYERGVGFDTNTRTNADGRRYRQHTMLVGLAPSSNRESAREAVNTWLYPGAIVPADDTTSFVRNNFEERLLVFRQTAAASTAAFTLSPSSRPVRNPAFRIEQWQGPVPVQVKVGGSLVPTRSAMVDGALLVWTKTTVATTTRFDIVAIPPTISLQPAPVSSPQGARVVLSVTAAGSTPLSYQWRKNGMDLPGGTSADLTLEDVSPSDAGQYSVAVSNAAGAIASSKAALSVEAAPFTRQPSTLANLSTRAHVSTGSDVLIAGFVINGPGAKRVLIRGVGPGLVRFKVDGTLVDPELVLFAHPDVLIARNDDWGDAPAIAQAGDAAGAFALPSGSRDAALVITLPPGVYTTHLRGVAGATGIGLAEVYDMDPGSSSRLVNISSRAAVGPGNRVMIAGFVTSGAAPQRFLVRAVGPTLESKFKVPGVLPDPSVALVRPGGLVLASNDDWNVADIEALTRQVGAFGLVAGSKDAALSATVAPGSYMPTVTDDAGCSGVALVEVYEAP
jgi:hypothetical protein